MIIETNSEQEIFLNWWKKEDAIVIPIWCDHELHPMMTRISFLYVRFQDDETDEGLVPMDFIIPLNHNDCDNINIDLTDTKRKHLVWNAKGLYQSKSGAYIPNVCDLHAHMYFNTNKHPDLEEELGVLRNFYMKNGLRDELGASIPIMKYKEVLRKFTTPILDSEYTNLETIRDTWVNSALITTLSRIEEKGIHVDTEKFLERWPDHAKFLKADKIYTEYNPYTPTTRPSNRHGGINFGALNKKDGTRKVFIPTENHRFVQFDYDAYHVRIIGKLIGYDLPKTSVHQWLADQYGCSYDESKGRTFKILYGGVSDEDRKIPFFAKVDELIQSNWESVQKIGYLSTLKGRRIYIDWIEDVKPQKLFNYYLQAIETEWNMDVIQKLQTQCDVDMILYQYDSFLFEYPLDIGMEKLHDIKKIVESNGFPVHMTHGTDYSKV